jgi:HEPN superfamily AbiU2-like protein
MTELSSEEVRTAALEAMGSPLGELYDILYNQLAWVHVKWNEHRALFGTSKERVDFLNEAAPAFFASLQSTLWDDVLLHLCRLTDPEKSAGKPNLTLRRLPALISNPSLRKNVEDLLKQAKEKTAFAREWRNRRLAHREFPAGITADLESLAPGSRHDVGEALTATRNVMNCIEMHYMKSSVLYERSIEALGSVDALLRCLEKGVEEKRRRKGLPPLKY